MIHILDKKQSDNIEILIISSRNEIEHKFI